MSFYTTAEIDDIITRLSVEPAVEKFIKFERLGVFVETKEEPEAVEDCEDISQLYTCSVCRKKLISAHLLDLHVVNHDSYFQLQKDKTPVVSKSLFSISK